MIICNLNIVSIPLAPSKAYSPLVIDADAVFSFAISREFLKTIPWGDTEIIQLFCSVQYREFSPSNSVQVWRNAPGEMS